MVGPADPAGAVARAIVVSSTSFVPPSTALGQTQKVSTIMAAG